MTQRNPRGDAAKNGASKSTAAKPPAKASPSKAAGGSRVRAVSEVDSDEAATLVAALLANSPSNGAVSPQPAPQVAPVSMPAATEVPAAAVEQAPTPAGTDQQAGPDVPSAAPQTTVPAPNQPAAAPSATPPVAHAQPSELFVPETTTPPAAPAQIPYVPEVPPAPQAPAAQAPAAQAPAAQLQQPPAPETVSTPAAPAHAAYVVPEVPPTPTPTPQAPVAPVQQPPAPEVTTQAAPAPQPGNEVALMPNFAPAVVPPSDPGQQRQAPGQGFQGMGSVPPQPRHPRLPPMLDHVPEVQQYRPDQITRGTIGFSTTKEIASFWKDWNRAVTGRYRIPDGVIAPIVVAWLLAGREQILRAAIEQVHGPGAAEALLDGDHGGASGGY